MLNTTLCYVTRGSQVLMLHRVKKKADINKDKWIGIGGKFEGEESPDECLLREAKEETGLTLTPAEDHGLGRPFFTSVGMTDESCATVYGRCTGTPTCCHQEATEEIQVVLADRQEARRILEKEPLAIMCAYQLMRYIATPGDALEFLNR